MTATGPTPLPHATYDAVIQGTGLPASLLAAALSRAGRRVLHLDPNPFYGDLSATLPLPHVDALVAAARVARGQPAAGTHAEEKRGAEEAAGGASGAGGVADEAAGGAWRAAADAAFGRARVEVVPAAPQHARLFPRGARALVDGRGAELPADARRRFLVDLAPRTLMAAGKLVDVLVRCEVGHSVDFRGVDALYVEADGLRRVPGSRAEVFRDRTLSMVEKRLLMRYVKRCYEDGGGERVEEEEEEEGKEKEGAEKSARKRRSFEEDMVEMGLTDKLRAFLIHSIAFCSGREGEVSSEEGATAVRAYQRSMARFSTNTPFLYPNYGSGEVAQAFCRLSAVHGGVYVLRRGVAAVAHLDREQAARGEGGDAAAMSDDGMERRKVYPLGVVTTAGDTLKCCHLFLPQDALPPPDHSLSAPSQAGLSPFSSSSSSSWHVIAVTVSSMVRDAHAKRITITVPRGAAGNETSAARLHQLDSATMVCPPGYYIVYAETVEGGGNENDVLAAVRTYVDVGDAEARGARRQHGARDADEGARERPRAVWGVVYEREQEKAAERAAGAVVGMRAGVAGVAGDDGVSLEEARRCFEMAMPGEVFLGA